MHKPLHHIEDTVTSVIALLVLGAMGFFGLVVLVLALALGSHSAFRPPLVSLEFEKRTRK
jgi:hypothetical protein